MSDLTSVKALVFDVFGTVVDWRTSLITDFMWWAKGRGINADWTALVDGWRGMYVASMDEVRKNPQRGYVILDVLHRRSLEKLVEKFAIKGLTDADLDHLTRGWHRLNPWPDSVAGLARLKSKFVIAPLSNGNVALLTNMAKFAGLPWDLVMSAELFEHYKPDPETYLGAARLLGLKPGEVMMVAAHNNDLAAAQKNGLKTAFVARPTEYGPLQKVDFEAIGNWDIVARDFGGIADRLGCSGTSAKMGQGATSGANDNRLLQTAFALCAIGAICGSLLAIDRQGVWQWLHWLTKPTATALLVVVVVRNAWTTIYGRAIAAGLVFALAGDVFLMLPGDRFLFGLICFLLTHFAYIYALTRDARPRGWPIFAGFAVVALLMVAGLWNAVPSAMRLPVAVYAAALAFMAAQAVSRAGQMEQGTPAAATARLAAIGGVFFLISDTILAYGRFRWSIPGQPLWVLGSYYIAQWLFARSTEASGRAGAGSTRST